MAPLPIACQDVHEEILMVLYRCQIKETIFRIAVDQVYMKKIKSRHGIGGARNLLDTTYY